MQRIGDIIRLYEPGPYPALEPMMHVGFLKTHSYVLYIFFVHCFVLFRILYYNRRQKSSEISIITGFCLQTLSATGRNRLSAESMARR